MGIRTEMMANDNAARMTEASDALDRPSVNWYDENIVTGRWKSITMRIKFPCKTLP